MSFLKNIFGKKEQPVQTYGDFWAWFQEKEKDFFIIVKNRKNIEEDFFDKMAPKLKELKDGILYLTGMYDDNTVELILTADGYPETIVFVEELVAIAPVIKGWKFAALKPSLDIKDNGIKMGGFEFGRNNQSFYSKESASYPDEIDIVVVHNDWTEENKKQISSGVYIFLDNYLGELDFLNNIDKLEIIGPKQAQQELIPIGKLKGFLAWRQKEFIEKYDGVRYNTEEDKYSLLEAEMENGNMLIAVINTELLNWDSKASHPWICAFTFKYDGSKSNGMPVEAVYKQMDKIEDEIMHELKDHDGHLNVGRETADGERTIYFACKDFRQPSKVFFHTQKNYSGRIEIEYEIYKDKYWKSFERFNSR